LIDLCGCIFTQGIEHAAFAQRIVKRAPPVGAIREYLAQPRPRCVESVGKFAQPLGKDALKPQAQMLCQARRSAARSDGQQHGIAVENAGRGKVAQPGHVDHIHQHARAAQVDRCILAGTRIVIGDEGQPHTFVDGALHVMLDDTARAFYQPLLRFCRFSIAQHQHLLALDAVE